MRTRRKVIHPLKTEDPKCSDSCVTRGCQRGSRLVSRIDKSVSNAAVIPVITGSPAFLSDPDARLATGIIGINGIARPGFEEVYRQHFEFRRRVYVEQTGQLDPSDLSDDGLDRDEDDARSVTFAVLENAPEGVRIVGVARTIIKGADGESRPLPVEDFCPELFANDPLADGSVEVSRVIARHERVAMQELVQWHLFALMSSYFTAHDVGRTFAIIEPWLERHLAGVLAISRIGEPRYIEHYLDYNLPVEFDLDGSAARINERNATILGQLIEADGSLEYFGRVSRAQREAAAALADAAAAPDQTFSSPRTARTEEAVVEGG
ncbi:GNAT family N-acyltransferase [Herbiconiux sp. KACC 21604]|uniref:GNAT family N-acyltransferase n=1 Tax=unclassified Herbiconiux TaxID=2618217 RepID=UPI001C117B7D|nr:GNAT family N-acyltransferase [Herbiconiux sp. SALV-R1]WPO85652.1 GNAT family N-acyltransferase [Herbiconiux sp. KACC 21604]